MRQLVCGLLAALLLLTACGQSPKTEAGFVVDVKATSLTQVDSFTLRTPEGEEILFRVGRLELDGGAFPAGHLREHLALAQALAVAYHEENGERVATRLVDATWLQP